MGTQSSSDIYAVVKRYADAWIAGDLKAIVFGLIVAVEQFERNGTSVQLERLLRYGVRDGKLSECWVYDEDQRLVDDYWA